MGIQILNPPALGTVQTPQGYCAPFKIVMQVSKGAQSLFVAQSSSGAYALAPLFLKKGVAVDITDSVMDMSWDAADGTKYTTLNLTLDNHRGVYNQIPHGTSIRVQVRRPFYNYSGNQQGKFYDYVSAFVFEKSRSADGTSQTISLVCYDKTYWLDQNQHHHVYKADSKHKGGWTASEMIRHLAMKLKLPIGTIQKTTKKLGRTELKGTALECINKALAEDKKATKRKTSFGVNMRDGKLNVTVENASPKTAYWFTEENSLESGSLSEKLGEKFATKLIVKGNSKTTKKTAGGNSAKQIKEVSIVMNSKEHQRAFGIITKTVKLKGSHSPAELRRLAKNQLEAAVRPEREFNISVRGVPHLWPGSRVWVQSGYFGVNGLVRVKSVSYSVDGGAFTLSMTLEADKKTTMSAEDMRLYYKKREIRY